MLDSSNPVDGGRSVLARDPEAHDSESASAEDLLQDLLGIALVVAGVALHQVPTHGRLHRDTTA